MISFGLGVSLRRLERHDLALLLKWRNDEAVWRWCRQKDLIHPAAHERWFEAQASDPTISMYGIVAGHTQLVGVCGLTDITHLHRRAEFSLYIGPDHQKCGLGRIALVSLFQHGFEDLGLNQIWGETFEGNPALKMFEGIGMKRDGVLRQFYWKGGRFIDCVRVSVLADEWKQPRSH